MIERRLTLVVTLALSVLLASFAAEAQAPGRVPKIGWLASGRSSSTVNDAFRQALHDLGDVEGKNVVIEYRTTEKFDRLPSLATELVRLKVDVIFASGGVQPALAAKDATKTIPIVVSNVGDPVAFGLVASLARPGGNLTGLSAVTTELGGKRLELLKEAFPKISRVAVLWSPDNPGSVVNKGEMETPARSLGIQLQSLEIREPSDLEQAFSAMERERAEAAVTINSPVVNSQQKRILSLTAKSRLPTMHGESRWVEAGGLMSYGPSYADLYRRAATYVDKILKGAKPADLPVEQPSKFELVINLRTAKALGLALPSSFLLRADQVIE
jgi:putative ABC transport system substrate-binding protein